MMSFGKTVTASSVAFGLVAFWYSSSAVQMNSWGSQPMAGWQAKPASSQGQQWQPPMMDMGAMDAGHVMPGSQAGGQQWAMPAGMPLINDAGGMGSGQAMAAPVSQVMPPTSPAPVAQTADWKPAEAPQPAAWHGQPATDDQPGMGWGDNAQEDTSKDDNWGHDSQRSDGKDCDHGTQTSWNDKSQSQSEDWGNKDDSKSDDWGSKADSQASSSDENWSDSHDDHAAMAQTASWDGGSKQSQGNDWGSKHDDCDHQNHDRDCRHGDDCDQSNDCE